jgi:crotonobetainyl-CoA:carnitine CoA-transferase CaiB-like acyl-CoA transferase
MLGNRRAGAAYAANVTGGALDGLRVLDLSTLFAAPQIAAILGDFGADVVKVEPPGGDPLRGMGAVAGPSPMWAFVGRNKRSVVLDADTDEGRARLHRLVEAADVVVENLPRPVLERWACTYDDLAARNPRLVVVTVSAYGATGPYAGRPGAGTLAEAFGGLTHLTGEADGPPMLSSVPLGDTVTALAGVIGALAACYRRDARGGTGQHVDVSMYEPILQLVGSSLARHDDAAEAARRSGSRVAGGVPRNVYETRDREWIAVSGTTDAQVARLLPLLDLDAEADVARFGTAAARLAVADELDAHVARWVAARDRDDALALFLDARIPAAPVHDLASILADPHVLARASVVSVDAGELGAVRMPAPFPRLSATPGSIRTAGPALGEHSDEVLREWDGPRA